MNRRTFIKGVAATAVLAASPAATIAQSSTLPSIKDLHVEGARKIALHYHRYGAEYACIYLPEYCCASEWRRRAYQAAGLLSTGGSAPLSDVKRLVIDLIPTATIPSPGSRVMLVHRGGKKKLKDISTDGVINLRELVGLTILTEEGAKAIREKRHDIYMR
jgi:hypothetical protein